LPCGGEPLPPRGASEQQACPLAARFGHEVAAALKPLIGSPRTTLI